MEGVELSLEQTVEDKSQRSGSLFSAATMDLLAGGVGGMSGIFAGQPLDTIRVRLQQKGNEYSGVVGAWRAMTRSREGPLSLYKGMAYPLCAATLQSAVTFWSFGSAMRLIHGPTYDRCDVQGYSTVLWSGAFAGAAQSLIATPVDLLKIRLQVQQAVKGDRDYVGPIQMLGRVLQNEGIRGLYRGLGITVIRDIPAYGGYFYAYYKLKDYLDPPFRGRTSEEESKSAMLAAGALAGIFSWCSYPADVIKSRIQVYDKSNSPYRNWYDCGVKAVRREGWGVLSRGLSPTLWHGIVACGPIFLAYEASIGILKKC